MAEEGESSAAAGETREGETKGPTDGKMGGEAGGGRDGEGRGRVE